MAASGKGIEGELGVAGSSTGRGRHNSTVSFLVIIFRVKNLKVFIGLTTIVSDVHLISSGKSFERIAGDWDVTRRLVVCHGVACWGTGRGRCES